MCSRSQGFYRTGLHVDEFDEDEDDEHGWGAWVVNPHDQVADHEGTELEEE